MAMAYRRGSRPQKSAILNQLCELTGWHRDHARARLARAGEIGAAERRVILVDTSAWIEYDRATGSRVDRRLTALIGDDGAIGVTEPVIMEVVSGARSDEREADLRHLLLRFDLLAFDAAVDFAGAAGTYRNCRKAGVTPRGMVDCMVATVAHRYGAALLAQDADLERVARVIGIEVTRRRRDHRRGGGFAVIERG